MSKPMLLNLDDVANPIARVIRWKGVDHSVVEQTVDQMLMGLRTARDAENVLEMTPDKQVELFLVKMKEAVMTMIPSLPEEDVGAMRIEQLKAILDFVNKENEELLNEASKEPEQVEGNVAGSSTVKTE